MSFHVPISIVATAGLLIATIGCSVSSGITCLEPPIWTINLPPVDPRSMAVSANAEKVILDGWDKTSPIYLIDVPSGKAVTIKRDGELPLANNAISRDGAFAIYGTGSVAHVYSVSDSPKHLKDFPYDSFRWGARFSPNGKSIALMSKGPVGKDGLEEYSNLDIYSVGSWKRKARLQTQQWDDYLCFSKGGQYIAITSNSGPNNIEVWDLKRQKLRGKVTLNVGARMVSDRDSESMVFTQLGKQPGTTVFKRLELPKMAVSTEVEGKFECNDLIYADREKVVVEASDDGSLSFKIGVVFVSGSKKGTARWLVSRKFDGIVATVDPTGKYLIVGDPAGKLLVYDLSK